MGVYYTFHISRGRGLVLLVLLLGTAARCGAAAEEETTAAKARRVSTAWGKLEAERVNARLRAAEEEVEAAKSAKRKVEQEAAAAKAQVEQARALFKGKEAQIAAAKAATHKAKQKRRRIKIKLSSMKKDQAQKEAEEQAKKEQEEAEAEAQIAAAKAAAELAKQKPLVLFYETDYGRALLGTLLRNQVSRETDVEVKTLGLVDSFGGFGTKHRLVLDELAKSNPGRLVVVSDYEDVVFNPAPSRKLGERLVKVFRRLTRGAKEDVVVVSGEHQCCAASLTYHRPGDIIAENGTRTARVCSSWRLHPNGHYSCTGVPGGNASWMQFMDKLATQRNATSGYNYLNAGLLAGRAADVRRLVEAMQISDEEDDQAVMTDLFFRRPDAFVIDYNQEFVANMRHPLGSVDGCVVGERTHKGVKHYVQREMGSHPIFLHFPSHHIFGCMRTVAAFVAEKIEGLLQLDSEMSAQVHTGKAGISDKLHRFATEAKRKSSFLATSTDKLSSMRAKVRQELTDEILRELRGEPPSTSHGAAALALQLLARPGA